MRLLLFGIATFLSLATWSQTYEVASRVYGGPQFDEVRAVVETADGGYSLLGTTASVSGDATDFYLLHINEDLTYAWSRPYGGIESDQGRSLAQFDNGDLLLAGFTNDSPGGDYDALVFRTTSEGDVIWEQNYGSTDWDFCEDIALLDDGSFILVGNTYAGSGGKNGWIMKADENGNILWEIVLEWPHEDWVEDVLLTTAGTLLIAWNKEETEDPASLRPYVLEMDQDGNILGEETYGENMGILMEIEEDINSYAAVGWYLSEGAEDRGQMVVGFDYALQQEWERLEVSPGDLALHALDDTPYGWVTTGPGNGAGSGGYAAYIQSRTTDGWWLQGIQPGGIKNETSYDVLLDSQNRIVVCGASASYSTFEDMDAWVVRLDSNMVSLDITESFDSYTDISLDISANPGNANIQLGLFQDRIEAVQISGAPLRLQLFSASGRLVAEEQGTGEVKLFLDGLAAGVFVLKLTSGDLCITQKLFR